MRANHSIHHLGFLSWKIRISKRAYMPRPVAYCCLYPSHQCCCWIAFYVQPHNHRMVIYNHPNSSFASTGYLSFCWGIGTHCSLTLPSSLPWWTMQWASCKWQTKTRSLQIWLDWVFKMIKHVCQTQSALKARLSLLLSLLLLVLFSFSYFKF